jgi:hypothetical protein
MNGSPARQVLLNYVERNCYRDGDYIRMDVGEADEEKGQKVRRVRRRSRSGCACTLYASLPLVKE